MRIFKDLCAHRRSPTLADYHMRINSETGQQMASAEQNMPLVRVRLFDSEILPARIQVMPARLAKSFSYKDATHQEASLAEFHKRLSLFSVRQVLHLCSAMNALLRDADEPINPEAHNALVYQLFPSNAARSIIAQKGRYIFHRQIILFIAQNALLQCRGTEKAFTQNDYWELGFLFLMGLDLMPASLPPSNNSFERSIRFIVHFIPIQESTVFHEVEYKIVRSYIMANQTCKKLENRSGYLNIGKQFALSTGLELEDFFALMLATLSRFYKFDLADFARNPLGYAINKTWFSSSKIPEEIVNLFLRELSASPSEIAAEVQNRHYGPSDFTALKKKPLFKDGENLFPIDFDFLAEKAEATIYWNILSKLPKTQQGSFQSFWGLVFEQYIADLLLTSSDPSLNAVYQFPKLADDKNRELCDVLVVCGSTAILIECKGSMFRAEAKYKANIKLLESEIIKKFVENKGKPEGIGQLAEAVKRISSAGRTNVCKEVNLQRVTTLFPVLITRDDIGGIVGFNKYLNEKFQLLIPDRKKYAISIAPLICAPCDALEYWCSYLQEIMFSELLGSHLKSQQNISEPLLRLAMPLPPFTSANPLLIRLGEKEQRLEIEWKKLMDKSLERLGLPDE
jgi:hypothetical protein